MKRQSPDTWQVGSEKIKGAGPYHELEFRQGFFGLVDVFCLNIKFHAGAETPLGNECIFLVLARQTSWRCPSPLAPGQLASSDVWPLTRAALYLRLDKGHLTLQSHFVSEFWKC